MERFKPEVLAPAGSLERLKTAILYGADAVYLGGQRYGLRARADNFTEAEIAEGVAFASSHNAFVYVVLNAFLHDEDFEGIAEFAQFLDSVGVRAVIVSDLGVIRAVRQSCNIEVHLSTQASCINAYAARVWKDMGVSRIVVGRELPVHAAGTIGSSLGVEIEMFAHGAMCMAFSGNCVISNFTAGRDSNRGGCIQSCRYKYEQTTIDGNGKKNRSHFMSSKDLLGAQHIPEFSKNQIHSLKLEGRMKSALYAATVSRVYRRLVDAWAEDSLTEALLDWSEKELSTLPHRHGCESSLTNPADSSTIYNPVDDTIRTNTHEYLGMVEGISDSFICLKLYHPVSKGDSIEFLGFDGNTIGITLDEMYLPSGERVDHVRQELCMLLKKTDLLQHIVPYQVVRIPVRRAEQAHVKGAA